jgi:hypothetical protein
VVYAESGEIQQSHHNWTPYATRIREFVFVQANWSRQFNSALFEQARRAERTRSKHAAACRPRPRGPRVPKSKAQPTAASRAAATGTASPAWRRRRRRRRLGGGGGGGGGAVIGRRRRQWWRPDQRDIRRAPREQAAHMSRHRPPGPEAPRPRVDG